jgi:very-short-patch-repair endonuclease
MTEDLCVPTKTKKMFTTFRPDLKLKAKALRKNMTEPENKLWFKYLRTSSAKFLRQKPIGNYIVDFYCASKRLVIEVDGDGHFLSEEEIKKDQERDKFLKKTFAESFKIFKC